MKNVAEFIHRAHFPRNPHAERANKSYVQFTTEADFRQPDRELLHQFEAPPAALVDPIPNQGCNFGDEERVPRSRHPVEVNALERPPKVTEHTGARYRNPHKAHSRPSALVSHPSLTVPSERLRFFGEKTRANRSFTRYGRKTKHAGDSNECFTLFGWTTKQGKKKEQPNWTLHRHV